MGERVVSLNGDQIPGQKEVVPEVVEALEWLLEAARSGEVVGIAAVAATYDDCVMRRARGRYVSHQVVGALTNIAHFTTSQID